MNSLYIFVFTSVRVAMRQLVRNKVRSFLTLLGILIGVGGVVTIVSLGEGLRGIFNSQLASQNTADLVYVMPESTFDPGNIPVGTKLFKNRDMEMVRGSDYVSSVHGGHFVQVMAKHNWRSDSIAAQAVPTAHFAVDNIKTERGRLYTPIEERAGANVIVIGSEIPEALYDDGEEVLGSRLQINGLGFTVIGVLEEKSAMQNGQSINKGVYMPLRTAQQRILGTDEVFWMAVKVNDSTQLLEAKEDIASRLRASRRIRSGADDDFSITTQEDWADFANGFVNTLLMVFASVALIALVVGGIGVMNIMLVSVRERTREIGLRKALGATPGAITGQFLVEAITLTVTGGLLGLLFGYGMGGVVSLIMSATLKVSWMPQVPLVWIGVVMITSVMLGLVFGVYPAWRAGQLDPIVALRYE
jgi:putative ABC transport system permease protein